MSAAEANAAHALDVLSQSHADPATMKSEKEKIGDDLLDAYMKILRRDGSMMQKSPCALI